MNFFLSVVSQVTIPEISAEVSKSDLKTASTNTLLPRFPKDFTVQNRKDVKSDDKIKDTTSTGLSYPSLSSKVAPFKPQRSSKPGSPLGKFQNLLIVIINHNREGFAFKSFFSFYFQCHLRKKRIFVDTSALFGQLQIQFINICIG